MKLVQTSRSCSCLLPVLGAQIKSPERKADGNVIISEREPKIRIELPQSVQYVDADRWVLYDMADCELHAFVEADGQKNVQRLHWVQFEGYLPSKPDLKHRYNSPPHATMVASISMWRRGQGREMPRSIRAQIASISRR